MRRILAASLLSLALLNLSGCVLAVGNGDDAGDDYSWHDSNSSSASTLATAVRVKLQDDALTHGADLAVSADSSGRVYIKGMTSNPEIVSRALQLALDTPDVKSVRCKIIVVK